MPGIREVFSGVAVDVGHAVLVVQDLDARSPGVDLGRRADRLEVLGQVVVLDVGVGDVAPQRGQTVVQRQLVARVDRRRETAVVTGRKDVAHHVLACDGLAGQALRRCGRDAEQGEHEQARDDGTERSKAASHDSPSNADVLAAPLTGRNGVGGKRRSNPSSPEAVPAPYPDGDSPRP
jgi:hypothetical protein